jgi:hypothetical protein
LPTVLLGTKYYELGFILLWVPLLSPFLFPYLLNKKIRQSWNKEGKDFLIGIWNLIIFIGILLGIIILVSLFFLSVGVIFHWLAGLGITTLLILILMVLMLK